MAAVLRKNRSWLHGLLKDPQILSQVVPQLYQHNILPAEAPLESVDSNSRAIDVLESIEKEMEEHTEPCSLGLEFINVLCGFVVEQSALKYLKMTADEFREERKAASRRSSRSSMDSSAGCLDTSSSSVFSTPEKKSEKCQESTGGSVEGTRERRRHLSEGSGEVKSTESDLPQYKHSRSFSEPVTGDLEQSPQQNKVVCNTKSYSFDREFHDDNLDSPILHSAPALGASVLQSIKENPDSPDMHAYKKFTVQASLPEHSSSSLSMHSETVIDECATIASVDSYTKLSDEQFSAQESSIMATFVRAVTAVQETDGTKNLGVMQAEYEKMLKHYQQMMKQAKLAHDEEAKKLYAAVEYHRKLSEKREQDLIDKDHQLEQMGQELDERKGQLAEREKELYEVQKEKKRVEDEMKSEEEKKEHEIKRLQFEKEDMEEECVRLRERLNNKENQVKVLERNIMKRQLELELHRNAQLLQSSQTMAERNDKDVIDKKMKQWEEMKNLVDRLFKKGNDIIQAKLAIVQQLNAIKHTGRRRPSTVPATGASLHLL